MSVVNVKRSIAFALSAGLLSWVALLGWNAAFRPAIAAWPQWRTLLIFTGFYAAGMLVAGAVAYMIVRPASWRRGPFALLAALTAVGGMALGTTANVASFSFERLTAIGFSQSVLLLLLVCTSLLCSALAFRRLAAPGGRC